MGVSQRKEGGGEDDTIGRERPETTSIRAAAVLFVLLGILGALLLSYCWYAARPVLHGKNGPLPTPPVVGGDKRIPEVSLYCVRAVCEANGAFGAWWCWKNSFCYTTEAACIGRCI